MYLAGFVATTTPDESGLAFSLNFALLGGWLFLVGSLQGADFEASFLCASRITWIEIEWTHKSTSPEASSLHA
jgi:hypothetical protein